MAENSQEKTGKKRSYIPRLFWVAKDDLSLLEIVIDLIVVLMLTILALTFQIAEKSESRELFFFAIGYFVLSLIAVIVVKVFVITPYKIIKEQDEKNESLLEKFEPKFRLSCDKTTEGRTTISGNTRVVFLRMKVETDCLSGVDGCLGHLYKIEKDGIVVFGHDSLELPFAKAEEPDSLSKRIVPDDPKWIGILAIHLHQPEPMSEVEMLVRIHNPHALPPREKPDYVAVATKQHDHALDIDGNYIFSRPGEYILHVNVVGKDAPTAKARLKFTWTGYAKDSTIEMIQ